MISYFNDVFIYAGLNKNVLLQKKIYHCKDEATDHIKKKKKKSVKNIICHFQN